MQDSAVAVVSLPAMLCGVSIFSLSNFLNFLFQYVFSDCIYVHEIGRVSGDLGFGNVGLLACFDNFGEKVVSIRMCCETSSTESAESRNFPSPPFSTPSRTFAPDPWCTVDACDSQPSTYR